MKDEAKGQEVGNFRPIACLQATFKLVTGIIADYIYEYLKK